jgi:hypothetical protein
MSDANTLEVRGITMLVLKRDSTFACTLLFSDGFRNGQSLNCTFAMTFALLAFAMHNSHRISRDAEACLEGRIGPRLEPSDQYIRRVR